MKFECHECEIAIERFKSCPNCDVAQTSDSPHNSFEFQCLVCLRRYQDQSQARCAMCFVPSSSTRPVAKLVVETITAVSSSCDRSDSAAEIKTRTPLRFNKSLAKRDREISTRTPEKKKKNVHPAASVREASLKKKQKIEPVNVDERFELMKKFDFQPLPSKHPKAKHHLDNERLMLYFECLNIDIHATSVRNLTNKFIVSTYDEATKPLRALKHLRKSDKTRWLNCLSAAKQLIDHFVYDRYKKASSRSSQNHHK